MAEAKGAAEKSVETETVEQSMGDSLSVSVNSKEIVAQGLPTTTSSVTDNKRPSVIQSDKASVPSSSSRSGNVEGDADQGGAVSSSTDANATTNKTTEKGGDTTVCSTTEAKNSPSINTGNDRITVDSPQEPLVSMRDTMTVQNDPERTKTSDTEVTDVVTNQETTGTKKSDRTTSHHSSAVNKAANEHLVIDGKAGPSADPRNSTNGPSLLGQRKTQHIATGNPTPKRPLPTAKPGPSFIASQSVSSYQTGVAPERFIGEHDLLLSETEDAIRRQRAPLVDKYPPYIINADTSLEEARNRLRIALDQTRQLRAAFTERVYSKYRVCLKPPPQTEEILETLKEDPRGMYRRLQAEMKRTKAEKDAEKKEAQKISDGVAAAAAETSDAKPDSSADKTPSNLPTSVSNKDVEESLMFVTSGLSLIVLPESNVSNIDLSMYSERGPVDPSTAQRARGISAAAASAGEVILERARKGQEMRAERQKKRSREQHENSSTFSLPHENFDSYYCKKTHGPTQKTSNAAGVVQPTTTASSVGPSLKAHSLTKDNRDMPAAKDFGKTLEPKTVSTSGVRSRSSGTHAAASAKAIRARVQATMSMNTLLSLNPIHEELRNDTKYSASTLSMMERGVGTQSMHIVQHHKNTPHRFKHPFPNSLGGRRRAVGSGVGGDSVSAFALPNVPSVKERRQYKQMKALPRWEASSSKAKLAVVKTLRQFDDSQRKYDMEFGCSHKKRRITEIDFLRGLSEKGSATESKQTVSEPPMDSALVLNVMKAIGLLSSSTSALPRDNLTNPSARVSALFDKAKLKAAGVPVESGPLFDSIAKLTSLESRFSEKKRLSSESRQALDGTDPGSREEKLQPSGSPENCNVDAVPLRGGGGEVAISRDEGERDPKVSPSETENGSNALSNPNPQVALSLSTRSSESLQNQTMTAPAGSFQNVLWNERSQQPMVLLQAPMLSNGSGASQGRNGHQQLLPAEHYHQTNALQLAHQLRMSRLPNGGHPTAGDLAEYIGALHPQQAAYDWSAVGVASAAAAVASSHSLAALGLNQHRHPMVPLTVQDHTRALLTREQQNLAAQAAAAQRQHQAVAMLGGTTTGTHPYVSSVYPQLAGHLLNHSAAALIGQNGMLRMPLQTGAKAQPPNVHPPQKISNQQEQQSLDRENSEGANSVEHERGGEIGSKDHQKQANLTETDMKRKSPPFRAEMQGTKRSRPNPTTEEKIPVVEKDSRPDGGEETPPKGPGLNGSAVGTVDEGSKATKTAAGLQYFVPPTPENISSDVAFHVLAGRCHDAITKSLLSMPAEDGSHLVNFVVAVGFAVPIPKAMVMHRLKDRMNHPMLKTAGAGGIPASTREVIAAEIMIWLWRNNEDCFQRAFAKSGRIDVDAECKWVVDAAVNKAVSALSDQITQELSSRAPNSLVSSMVSHKSKCIAGKGAQANDSDNLRASAAKVDLLATLCVSRALNMAFALNEEMDELLPTFHDQIGYLDEARKCALYCKSQERALLASIVSRKATMSFSFSHSYVSAMVRAGEALGHGSLFEAVQNEKYSVSTMIPYDVFTDESYAWEDPCRPALGFTEGLTGDEMMRRAHARAMIQKSLKKLQERHNIRGGTPIPGPYVDQSAVSSSADTPKSGSSTPRGTLQRRRSFSEIPVQQGSGAAPATSSSLYDPKHICPSLEWLSQDTDNSPYGRHDQNTKSRSLSLAQGAAVMRLSGKGGKGLRRQNSGRQGFKQVEQPLLSSEKEEKLSGPQRSTREIPWKDVAGIFQHVQLPSTLKEKQELEAKRLSTKDRTIFAPVVRKLSSVPIVNTDDSSDEEDLSNDAVLSRHQVVLNEMKLKLTAIQESRKKAQTRKSRDRPHK